MEHIMVYHQHIYFIHKLHKESNTYLWYLIVEVTDEYLRKHITEQKYEEMKKICQNEVNKITKRKKKRRKRI